MSAKLMFVILDKKLGFHEIDLPSSIIKIGGKIYRRDDNENTHGFYDWLRASPNQIIGIRLFLFEDYQFVIDGFRSFDYVDFEVTSKGNSLLYLYFSDQRKFNDKISDDQLFTGNYFYHSDREETAMTFEFPVGSAWPV